MQVNKKSWHFRLAVWSKEYEHRVPGDLCGYMRTVAGGAFKMIAIAVFLSIALGIASVSLISSVAWVLLAFPGEEWRFHPFAVIGTTIFLMSAVVTLIGLSCSVKNKIASKKDPDLEPGLIRSYIKAKKEKICPILEFTEGKEK